MKNNELIIAISPNTISERDFMAKARPVKWVYFGKNYLSKIAFKNTLNDIFSEVDISRPLDKVADEIRSDHVRWIDGISQTYGAELEWWFGNIASRNIYQSDLFQYCCYLVLLEKIWKDQNTRPSLIVVDSPGLALAIKHWGQERKIPLSMRGYHKIYSKNFFSSVRFTLRWLDFVIVMIMRKIASVVINKNNIIEKSHSCGMVMVSTFVHDSSFTDSGNFNDRYLPYLYEYIKKNNKSVLIHPIFHGFRYNFFTIFKKISRSTDDFVIQEKYLKLSDYFHAWIYPIYFLKQKIVVPRFHEFDLTNIINEDQMNVDIQNMLQAILTFRLIQKLKIHDLKLNLFIEWYENQTLNRGIEAGLHKTFPGVKTIGAQILLHCPNFFSLSPSPSEVRAGIVPDVLLTTSCYQCGLARAFDPSIQCIPAASLRYAHVFSEEKKSAVVSYSDKKFVLLLTSFNYDETIELLQMVTGILKDLDDNINIYIKFHPDLRTEEFLNKYPVIRRDHRYMIFNGSLSDGIRDASTVISNGSGSIVEAIAKGTPAIFVGNQNKLTINPLSGITSPLFTVCYSSDEVLAALSKYLNLSDIERIEYRNLGKSIRDIFFLPVNDDTLSPFLAP
ncbi:MAG: hypothetical protein WAU46_08865 [Methanoregula sp.]|uniref:hypothetical protein n=1 Tax=Methanoregula sp. TaxID=2052170 RepID=UPI003BB208E6